MARLESRAGSRRCLLALLTMTVLCCRSQAAAAPPDSVLCQRVLEKKLECEMLPELFAKLECEMEVFANVVEKFGFSFRAGRFFAASSPFERPWFCECGFESEPSLVPGSFAERVLSDGAVDSFL